MKDVVVIGAGVLGLCSAYYAAQRGFRVTVLDRNPELYPGCSYGNAGMIVPSHFVPLAAPGTVALGLKWMFNPESPLWIKPRCDLGLFDWALKFWRAANPNHVRRAAPLLRDLHMASRTCFIELSQAHNNDFGLVTRGLLLLCKKKHTLAEESKAAQQARSLGIPAEILDPPQTAALEPSVRMDIAGAVYFPKDCHLVPQRFMGSLKQMAQNNNVRFLYNTDVRAFRHETNQIHAAITNHGDITASEWILCAGSWSPLLTRSLKLTLPMQAGKGYSLTLPNPPQMPRICAILTEARIALTPMDSTLRIGGTMEMSGLNEQINPARIRGIIKAVPHYYPDFTPAHFEGIKPWCGLRPCSPDGLPYLGRPRHWTNLIVATGHAMLGLSLGPVSGQLVAQILSGDKPSIDIQLLNPDRYT